YKGNSLDKAGMGYSSIQSARHYMDEKPIKKDFDATLPERYWYEFEYVYKHNGREMENSHRSSIVGYNFHNCDYEEKFYVKDLTGEDKVLWDKVFAIEDKYRERGWGWAGKKVEKEMYTLLAELDKRGWYSSLFENSADYWKKYRKYKKENLQFVEKEVKIEVE
ncbi:MAG: hypothetical protein IJH64_08965, partial [Oscillospiraceae bacterium]|nr:hypothetical protein [Oscillospiraceae bacterium]